MCGVGAVHEDLKFGDWLVYPNLGLVSRGGQQRKLERKAMEVLVFLLSRPGEVVSVQTIREHVWAGRVVEENSVHRRISQLRKMLDDDAHNPRYIASLPRRGYRTLATVTPLAKAQAPVDTRPAYILPAFWTGVWDKWVTNPSGVHANGVPAALNPWSASLMWFHQIVLNAPGRIATISAAALAVVLAAVLLSAHQPPPGSLLFWQLLVLPGLIPVWFMLARRFFHPGYHPAGTGDLVEQVVSNPTWPLAAVCINVLLNVFLSVLGVLAPWAHSASVLAGGGYLLLQIVLIQLVVLTALYVVALTTAFRRTLRVDHAVTSPGTSELKLNFTDPDRRFGLGRLSALLNTLIGICLAGGFSLLVYRYLTVDRRQVAGWADQLSCSVGGNHPACEMTFDSSLSFMSFQQPLLFLLAVVWFSFFLWIMWRMNVKLLPFSMQRENEGLVAYLRHFLPEQDRARHPDASQLAAQFRRQDSSPLGDSRVADALRGGFLMFGLMLCPVLPSSMAHLLVLAVLILGAELGSRGYRMLQKHLLSRVDLSLT